MNVNKSKLFDVVVILWENSLINTYFFFPPWNKKPKISAKQQNVKRDNESLKAGKLKKGGYKIFLESMGAVA